MKRTVEEVETSWENKSRKSDDNDGSSSSSSSSGVEGNSNSNILRNETEFLVQSNLLRLQTEELVNEVQGTASSPSIEKCIEKIKTCLMSSSSSSSSSSWYPKEEINATWLKSKGIKGLDFTNYSEVEQVLSYEKPIAISIVGSYALRTGFKATPAATLLVQMPTECFHERDLLNYGYFDKRKLYLGVLALMLSKDKTCCDDLSIEFDFMYEDERKPVIIATILHKKKVTTITLIPSLSPSIFKLTRLLPSKNNARPLEWLQRLKKATLKSNNKKQSGGKMDSNEFDPSALPATPTYNASILEDISALVRFNAFKEDFKKCGILVETCILLMVWLRQCGLFGTVDSIQENEVFLIASHLFRRGLIYPRLTPLNAFKITINFLAKELCSNDHIYSRTITGGEFSEGLENTRGIYINIEGVEHKFICHNALWRMSKTSYDELARKANTCLLSLENVNDGTFDNLFMTHIQPLEGHDLVFYIPTIQTASYLKNGGNTGYTALEHLSIHATEILSIALKGRVKWFRVLPIRLDRLQPLLKSFSWNIRSSTTVPTNNRGVLIYMQLDERGCSRRVEKGPEANNAISSVEMSAELQEFKKLWGDGHTEMRRFQDGSIVEALVWKSNDTEMYTGAVVTELINHIFRIHLPLFNTPSVFSNQFEEPFVSFYRSYGYTTNAVKMNQLAAIKTTDELRNILSSKLTGLPLIIESVASNSTYLRYTSSLPPCTHPSLDGEKVTDGIINTVVVPLTLVATIESSGKWPDDDTASIKTKLALLLRIGSLLEDQFQLKSLIRSETVCLDIAFNGYMYRLYLNHQHEFQVGTTLSVDSSEDKKVILDNFIAPLHHTNIHNLSTTHPSYAGAVSLLRYWLDNHLFSSHISIEATELIVASVYLDYSLNSSPSSSSSSPSTSVNGFLKSLKLLAEYNWDENPLYVHFRTDDEDGDYADPAKALSVVNQKFLEYRQNQRHFYRMFITSSSEWYLGYESVFSRTSPESVVFRMITSQAKRSYQMAMEFLLGCLTPAKVNEIHPTNLMEESDHIVNNCNVILHFNPAVVKKHNDLTASYASVKVYKNASASSKDSISFKNLICKNDSICPVQYEIFHKIQSTYGHLALFFWNELRGDKICLVWRPKVTMVERFSVVNTQHRLPSGASDSSSSSSSASAVLLFDAQSVVTEIIALADGCINEVEFR